MSGLDRSLIAALPPFAGAGPAQLDAVLDEARSVYRARGSSLYEQDKPADSFFVLLHGRLRVTRLTPDGRQVVVRFAGPGELVGVAVALGRDTYPATAAAAVDSVALAWPSARWPQMLGLLPALAGAALQAAGARLHDAHSRIVELSTEQVERRVANALVRLSETTGRRVEQGILIDFPISRQDVAEATGTTLHNVSRILSAWEERGWVKGGRQRIVICEPHRLMSLGEGYPANRG
ncbi:cyclic nucleotide-binding domain-containing protein [Microvirga thermotolerans]|uniref:Cyclic nucleotide-binding domain-containing protein n=2 Tax=Microvirga thermotolerans TaxID=2651334 RepID=A0A5P9JZU5_9HYPH|nr:Crp/Fnr family transcriptional regulator [Microvirga thermotolerans]QFU17973.1 cyclic nucleotide-binding domain-containing protein [Microvirga thermotolerans]